MVATDQDYRRWEWDPFLPTNWRYQDACRLTRGERGKWSSVDLAIVECAAYLRAVTEGHDEQAVRHRWPWLAAAHEIAEQDNPRRWELESRVLANQPVNEISARCGLLPEVIGTYEALFFDVRARLGAGIWITSTVIGDGLQRGFADHEVGPLWRALAYFGGPLILDALLDAFHAARRPDEPLTLSIYLRPDSGIDPGIQANVASLVLPHYGPAGRAWMAFHLLLIEADATHDQDRRALLRERARDGLISSARACLAGKPLPRFRQQKQKRKERDRSAMGAAPGHSATQPCEFLRLAGLSACGGPDQIMVRFGPAASCASARNVAQMPCISSSVGSGGTAT
jgi:hypothetical protein